MVRTKVLTISAYNITIHPHKPEKYIQLIKSAEKSKTAIRVHGETKLQFIRGIFSIDSKNQLNGIYGEIAKFTDIPDNAKWLNLSTESAAGEEELKALVIPPHLKPNYQGFTFIFYPLIHKLIVEQKNGEFQLSPNYVEKFLNGIFSLPKIKDEYGKVDVTVMPEKNKIKEILGIPNLKKIRLVITRPNPDDLGDDIDEEILKILDSENIGKQEIVNNAVKGKSLSLNRKSKTLAEVASENGFVEAVGEDNQGIKIEDSTRTHPFKLSHKYNPAEVNLLTAMQTVAQKAIDIFRGS